MEYCELFNQNRQLCKMGRQEKLQKIHKISHVAPYYFDVIINLALLHALLKKSVAPGCLISILARKA